MLDQIHSLPRTHASRKLGVQTTRDRLMAVGLQKVLEGGWAATSIDAVLRDCAVPKGSFYHYFASKEAFGYALLESYQAAFMRQLHQRLVDVPMESLAHLQTAMQGFLTDSVARMQRHHYQQGCLVGALGQELASLHDGFRVKLLECLQEWEKTLSSALFNTVSSYINNSNSNDEKLKTTRLLQMRCDASARDFWVTWQGALLRSLLARSPQALHAVVQGFLTQVSIWPEFAVASASSLAGILAKKRTTGAGSSQRQKSIKSKIQNEINNMQAKLKF